MPYKELQHDAERSWELKHRHLHEAAGALVAWCQAQLHVAVRRHLCDCPHAVKQNRNGRMRKKSVGFKILLHQEGPASLSPTHEVLHPSGKKLLLHLDSWRHWSKSGTTSPTARYKLLFNFCYATQSTTCVQKWICPMRGSLRDRKQSPSCPPHTDPLAPFGNQMQITTLTSTKALKKRRVNVFMVVDVAKGNRYLKAKSIQVN